MATLAERELLDEKMSHLLGDLATDERFVNLDAAQKQAILQKMYFSQASQASPKQHVQDTIDKQRMFAFQPCSEDPDDEGRMKVFVQSASCLGLTEACAPYKHNGTMPAVDIGSGTAVYTLELSSHFKDLEFWPTEVVNAGSDSTGTHQTRKALSIMMDEAAERAPLFDDATGSTVRVQDEVILHGLQRAEFNGRKGVALCRRDDGRIGVQLGSKRADSKAFKEQNLSLGKSNSHDPLEDAMFDEWRTTLIPGLRERVREVNVVERRTWKNVEHLFGRCALVMCTSLLTQVGYREPFMWRDVLQLASELLAPGGTCFLYDTEKHGDFGDVEQMSAYIAQHSLKLTFYLRWHPIFYNDDEGDETISLVLQKGARRQRVAPPPAVSRVRVQTSVRSDGRVDAVLSIGKTAAEADAIQRGFDALTSRAVSDGLLHTSTMDQIADRLAACSDEFERSCTMLTLLDAALEPGRRATIDLGDEKCDDGKLWDEGKQTVPWFADGKLCILAHDLQGTDERMLSKHPALYPVVTGFADKDNSRRRKLICDEAIKHQGTNVMCLPPEFLRLMDPVSLA